jgi:hypothetical protein
VFLGPIFRGIFFDLSPYQGRIAVPKRAGIQAGALKGCSIEEFGKWWDKYFHSSMVVQLGNSPVRSNRERVLIAG